MKSLILISFIVTSIFARGQSDSSDVQEEINNTIYKIIDDNFEKELGRTKYCELRDKIKFGLKIHIDSSGSCFDCEYVVISSNLDQYILIKICEDLKGVKFDKYLSILARDGLDKRQQMLLISFNSKQVNYCK